MDMPSKCTIVTATRRIAYKLEAMEQMAIGTEATLGCNAQNTQKTRLYSMSVKLPIKTRKRDPRP